jgi:hypothetical protein
MKKMMMKMNMKMKMKMKKNEKKLMVSDCSSKNLIKVNQTERNIV